MFFLLVQGSAAFADSELYFPRISFGPDELTGLAIVNPNASDAIVTLTAYGGDGEPLGGSGFSNPVQITIGAGRQYAEVSSAIFGVGPPADQIGWVRAVSEANDLSGFFLFLTLDLTVFDGADLPEAASTIVFNEALLEGGFSTELNLVNPGAEPALVTLRLLGGGSPITKQVTLPALGAERFDAAEFFSAPEPGSSSLYVEASSDTDILGFEFIRGPGDLLGLNAKPASERLNSLYFPQLAVLGLFESQLQLVNYSNETAILTLTAHRPDGSLYGVDQLRQNPVNRALRGGESLREDLAEMFGFFGETGLDGWLDVSSTVDAVNGAMSYSIPSANSLASVASISQASQRAVFSHIATTDGFFTGVAVLNAAQLSANIQITALSRDGVALGSYSTALLPGQRISRLITELIADAAGQAGGMIFVSSDAPVYLTSLFGSLATGVLANIPPQSVPAEFQPGSAGPALGLDPALAILSPAAEQGFNVQGAPGTPSWSVNGVEGGNELVGTVTASGQYRAPAVVPEVLPVTVLAKIDELLIGASIDILSPEAFVGDLGLVQSVAYLEGAQRVYYSELTSFAGGTPAAGDLDRGSVAVSRLREVQGDASRTVVEFDGEEIPKIVAFHGADGQEYLLAAAQTSGRVLRVDPRSGSVVEVASGLNEPEAMVLDPVEGELLVAEADQVSSIPASQLNLGLSGSPLPAQGGAPSPSKLFASSRGRIAVDQCTGNAYVVQSDQGRVLEFGRRTGALRVVAEGLRDPGQPLGVYRRGLGCPDAFHLLVPERGTESVLLLLPSRGLRRPWLDLSRVQDLAFIPPGSTIAPGGGVMIASLEGAGGRLTLVRLPNLYKGRSVNPPVRARRSGCSLTQMTKTRGDSISGSWVSGDGGRVIVVASADFTGENADGSLEMFAFDGPSNPIVQLTNLAPGRQIHDVAVNRDGTRIVFRSDARLVSNAPSGQHLYLLDATESEFTLLARDQEGPAGIDREGRRVVFASRMDPLGTNGDGNFEIFLADSQTGISQITVTESAFNVTPAISRDGGRLVFRSNANLQGKNPAAARAVFVYDVADQSFVLVGVESPGLGDPPSTALLIDGVGGRVLFPSELDLTGEAPSSRENLYLAQVDSGTFVKVLAADPNTRWHSLTADGRLLSLASDSNPVRENRDRNREAFLYDLAGGEAVQLTRSRGAVNSQPRLNEDGSVGTILSDADFTGENGDLNTEVFRLGCVVPPGE